VEVASYSVDMNFSSSRQNISKSRRKNHENLEKKKSLIELCKYNMELQRWKIVKYENRKVLKSI